MAIPFSLKRELFLLVGRIGDSAGASTTTYVLHISSFHLFRSFLIFLLRVHSYLQHSQTTWQRLLSLLLRLLSVNFPIA